MAATVIFETWPNEEYHDSDHKFPFIAHMLSQIDCPIVDVTIDGYNSATLIIDGYREIFFKAEYGHDTVTIGDYTAGITWWSNTFNILIAYSDTFFYIFSRSGNLAYGGGTNLNYLYEIISEDLKIEGYLDGAPAGGNQRHVPIYDYFMYDIVTRQAYTHSKILNYVAQTTEEGEETLEFTQDVLFDSSTKELTRHSDVNFITCTTLPEEYRQQIVVFDSHDYFVIETNLLIPLFDPEPGPEPNPEENSD